MTPPPAERQHILLFDLTHQAHFSSFLRHWLLWWERQRPTGRFTVVVDPYLLERHPELRSLERRCREGVRLLPITSAQKRERKSRYAGREYEEWPLHRLLRPETAKDYPPLFDWSLFCTYARQEGASHAVMANIDQFLPLLAAGCASPERFSGISFCATFPGRRLQDPSQNRGARPLPGDALLLARSLRHPHLHSLFMNDAEWVELLRSFTYSERVVHLPEVAELNAGEESTTTELRRLLRDLDGRVVFLVFGDLWPRKGVMTAMAAMARLTQDQQQRAALVIAGRSHPTFEEKIHEAACSLRNHTSVAVLECHRFLSEEEVAVLFDRADVVLTLYTGHAGMSNVILLAAAAQRPVLSSAEGRMGKLVEQEKLGRTVDAADPDAVAAAVAHCLEAAPGTLGNAEKMRDLAARHTGEHFAGTFFRRLGLVDGSG
jgi:glycosyltransferase involved in cell wall biosynthesis